MGTRSPIPNAWDDDWESLADAEDSSQTKDEVNLTKAERLAKHAETNKKIWKSAEEPEAFHFLAVQDKVPLKTDFKPALTLLSRKPAPRMITEVDPITGFSKLKLEKEAEGDESQTQPSSEEIKLKAQKEREDKQKRYELARARILGTPSTSQKNVAGTNSTVGSSSSTRNGRRGKGFGRKSSYDLKLTEKTMELPKSSLRENQGIIRAPRIPDSKSNCGFATRGGRLR